MLSSNFNLKYELNDNLNFESPSGEKLKYYSTKMNGVLLVLNLRIRAWIQLAWN